MLTEKFGITGEKKKKTDQIKLRTSTFSAVKQNQKNGKIPVRSGITFLHAQNRQFVLKETEFDIFFMCTSLSLVIMISQQIGCQMINRIKIFVK